MNNLHTTVVFALWLTTVSSMIAMEQENVSMRKNEQKSSQQTTSELIKVLEGLDKAADVASLLACYREASLLETAQTLLNTGTLNDPALDSGEKKALFEVGLWCENKSKAAGDMNEAKIFLAEAIKIYQELAEQDYAKALNRLGFILVAPFMASRGAYSDLGEQLLRRAASQGDCEALINLGALCEQRSTLAAPHFRFDLWCEAQRCYLSATEQNSAEAQNKLGNMYFKESKAATGEQRLRSLQRAEKWCRKAADQGYAWAQNNMGIISVERYNVAADEDQKMAFLEEAIPWLGKAADQNVEGAQRNLATVYDMVLKRYLQVINRDIIETNGADSKVLHAEDIQGYALAGELAAKDLIAILCDHFVNPTEFDGSAIEARVERDASMLDTILKVTSPRMTLHQKALQELVTYVQTLHTIFKSPESISKFINRPLTEDQIKSLYSRLSALADYFNNVILKAKNYAEIVIRRAKSARQALYLMKCCTDEKSQAGEEVSEKFMEARDKLIELKLTEVEEANRAALQQEIACDIEKLGSKKINVADELLAPDIFFQRGLRAGKLFIKKLTLLTQGLFLTTKTSHNIAFLQRLCTHPYDVQEFSKIKKYCAGMLQVLEQFNLSELTQQCEEGQAIKIRQEYNFNLRLLQIIWYARTWKEADAVLAKLFIYRGDLVVSS